MPSFPESLAIVLHKRTNELWLCRGVPGIQEGSTQDPSIGNAVRYTIR